MLVGEGGAAVGEVSSNEFFGNDRAILDMGDDACCCGGDSTGADSMMTRMNCSLNVSLV